MAPGPEDPAQSPAAEGLAHNRGCLSDGRRLGRAPRPLGLAVPRSSGLSPPATDPRHRMPTWAVPGVTPLAARRSEALVW